MKRKLTTLLLIIVCALACVLGFTACGETEEPPIAPPAHTPTKPDVSTPTIPVTPVPSPNPEPAHEHTLSGYEYDEDQHWKKCLECNETVDKAAHDFSGTDCTVCDYAIPATSGLVFEKISDKEEYKVVGFDNAVATKIIIPNRYNGIPVTRINTYAFRYCKNIAEIMIPDSVISIGGNAFEFSDSLTIYCEATSKPSGWDSGWNVKSFPVVWDSNNNDIADDGYIYTVIDGLRYGIKNGVATIVRQLGNITMANIPSSITYKKELYYVNDINSNAFQYNDYLEKAIIANGIKSIGEYAFSYCDSLTEIEIPDSVTSIGEYALSSCDRLTKVVIPDSVISIGDYAFAYCGSLTIYCEATSKPSGWNTYWDYSCSVVWDCRNNEVADDGYVYTAIDGLRYGIKDGVATVVGQPENITTANIPSSVTYKNHSYSVTNIGNSAFSSCSSLTEVVIPASVKVIGDYAFRGCSGLTEVIMPDSVTTVCHGAFSDCSKLVNVVIGNKVEYLGIGAFSNCDRLTNVSIPDSVINIEHSAFVYCSKLQSITVNANNTAYKSIDGNLYTKDEKTLIQYATGKTDISFVIPDNVTSIGGNAFRQCRSLTEIVIPDSVTSIGNYAFDDCDSLQSITVGADNTAFKSIDGNLYTGNGRELIQYAIGKTATSFVVPDSVESIGDRAFYGCGSLTEVVISDSVKSIGEHSFYYCTSLTEVVIPDSITSIGNYAFYYCRSLTSVIIPDSVTSIGNYAFDDCDSLTIYCEVSSKPSGWKSSWNYSNCPIVWGYTGE